MNKKINKYIKVCKDMNKSSTSKCVLNFAVNSFRLRFYLTYK